MSFESPKKGEMLKGDHHEYLVESTNKLGSGGNGYIAPVQSRDCMYAVKVYNKPVEDAERLRRFKAECEILERIKHPYITPIIDRGEWNGRPFYVMPRAKCSLHDLIPAIQTMPNEYVVLARGITDALVQFHSNKVEGDGCWHRDIKPANILWFDEVVNGQQNLIPKISDFGIAHLCPGFIDIELETTQRMMSHDCFAPEQRERAEGDQRSDIFSWGFVLWWAATGIWPRGIGAKPSQCMKPVLNEYIDMILEKALNVNPENRFQSMGAFKAAIESYFSDLPRIQAEWKVGNWSIDGVTTTPQEVAMLGFSSMINGGGTVDISRSHGIFSLHGRPMDSQDVAARILEHRQNTIKKMLGLN